MTDFEMQMLIAELTAEVTAGREARRNLEERMLAMQATLAAMEGGLSAVQDEQEMVDDPAMVSGAAQRYFGPPPEPPIAVVQLEDNGWDPGTDTAGTLPPVQNPWDAIGDGASWSGVSSPDFDEIIATDTDVLARNATHSRIDVGVEGYFLIGYSFVIDYPDGDPSNKQQIKSRVVRNAGAGDVELAASTAWITDTRRDAWQVGTTFMAHLYAGDYIELQIGRYEYTSDWACLTGSPQICAALLRRIGTY